MVTFALSNGKLKSKPKTAKETRTLRQVLDGYSEGVPAGALESTTLATIKVHQGHFRKVLGDLFPIRQLTAGHLQDYVNTRSKHITGRGSPISPVTIKKELITLSAIWNWALLKGYVDGPFPNKGLKFPKTVEKPPFQTWEEIERKIARGGLSEAEQAERWDSLFLTLPQIAELLEFVKGRARRPFIYPMFVFAAHTGARRSELLRSRIEDLDFDGNTVLIREKKRVRDKHTTRRVPMSPLLSEVLRDWTNRHPGGPHTFCHDLEVPSRKVDRTELRPLTRDEAHDHFKRTLEGSRWEKLRGWHVFRHSFCSNCAARGIDQRLINEWVGHQTEEMVRRYRHLIPDQQRSAIMAVFGNG